MGRADAMHRSANNPWRSTPRDPVGLGLLREVSAPRATRLRRPCDPLGAELSSDKLPCLPRHS